MSASRVCRDFNARKCKRGSGCPFLHPGEVCFAWQQGKCKNKQCTRLHPTTPCNNMAQQGQCSYGNACKFRHYFGSAAGAAAAAAVAARPQPAAACGGAGGVAFSGHIGLVKPVMVFLASVDTSASMQGEPIEVALRGLGHIATKIIPADAAFGCFTFSCDVNKLHHPMKRSTVDWKKDHKNILNEVRRGSGTAIYDAVLAGIEELAQFQQHQQRTNSGVELVFEHLLITDGDDNSSSASLQQAADKVAHPGLANYHLRVVGVGLSRGAQESMKHLTASKHASFVHANNVDELRSCLDREGQRIQIKFSVNGTTTVWTGDAKDAGQAALDMMHMSGLAQSIQNMGLGGSPGSARHKQLGGGGKKQHHHK